MRAIKHFVPITLCVLVLLASGCSKKDDEGSRQAGQEEGSIQKQGDVRTGSKSTPQQAKTATEQNAPRNLWDLWEETSISLSRIAGMTWDGKALWVLDPTSKTICQIGKNGEIAKTLGLSMQPVPIGLAFDGRAFWTMSQRAKRIYRLGLDGSQTSFQPGGGMRPYLECVDGTLLYTVMLEMDLTRMDTVSHNVLEKIKGPCLRISDMAWDGRYLWCVYDKGTLVGHDLKHQLPFTGMPLKASVDYVAFGGGKCWLAPAETSGSGSLTLYSFPEPRNGDVCMSKRIEETRIIATGVFNPDETRIVEGATVLIGAMPLDDLHQRLEDIRFDPPYSSFLEDDACGRWAVIPNLTIGPQQMLSITGTIKYRRAETYKYVILPDDLDGSINFPESVRASSLELTDEMQADAVVRAAKEAIGDDQNPYWRVRSIHDWIIDHIEKVVHESEDLTALLESGKTVCGGYANLTQALCRLNGIPCRIARAGGEGGSHSRNEVFLAGLNRWIDVDVHQDDTDKPRSSTYITSQSIGRRKTQLSHRVADSITWNGEKLDLPRFNQFNPDARPKITLALVDAQKMSKGGMWDNPPACYARPHSSRTTDDGWLEILWGEGYDLEDGKNLKYRVYAHTSPMRKKRNEGILVAEVNVPYWRVQGLDSAGRYFFRVQAVDSSGNVSDDDTVSGNMMQTQYAGALLRRHKAFKN